MGLMDGTTETCAARVEVALTILRAGGEWVFREESCS